MNTRALLIITILITATSLFGGWTYDSSGDIDRRLAASVLTNPEATQVQSTLIVAEDEYIVAILIEDMQKHIKAKLGDIIIVQVQVDDTMFKVKAQVNDGGLLILNSRLTIKLKWSNQAIVATSPDGQLFIAQYNLR